MQILRRSSMPRLLIAAFAILLLASTQARAEEKEKERKAPPRPAPHAAPQRQQPQQQTRSAPEQRQQPQQQTRSAPEQRPQPQQPARPQPQQQRPQPQQSPQQAQQRQQPNNTERAQTRPAQPQRTNGAQPPQQRAQSAQPNRPAEHPAYTLPANHPAMQAGARATPLNPAESHQVVSQVNASRAGMSGVNRAPLPQGNVSVAAGGGLHIESGNRNYAVRANGTMASYSTPAHSAHFRPDGSIASVHTNNGLNISRSPGGARVIVRERPNGVVVVSNGSHYGYVQRPVVYGGRSYVTRTYVSNGVVYTRAYHPYYYGGVTMVRYEPNYYYHPAYYRWAWSPWAQPVSYEWGYRRDPWYGYYGSYYTPMPYYPSPAYWLGDYLLAAELRESYDARASANNAAYAQGQSDGYAAAQANPGGDGPDAQPPQAASPITPEVRAAIAEEVQRQLAEEGNAASSGADVAPPPPPQTADSNGGAAPASAPQAAPQAAAPPPDAETPIFLQTPGRVFVVSSNIDVVVDQDSCSLSSGDVLRLDTVPPAGEVSAAVRVLSSKSQDCTANSLATLSVDDLQEMYNNLHAKIDSGLGELKTAQGTAGMPAAPTTATTAGPGAAVPPPADDSAAELAQTQRDADAAEAELDQEMKNNSSGAAPAPAAAPN